MKKTIRLTETELIEVIKKVLHEQLQPDRTAITKQCFMETFNITDINKIPNECVTIASLLMKDKRALPNPFDPNEVKLSIKCASGLAKKPEFVAEKMKLILDCLIREDMVQY